MLPLAKMYRSARAARRLFPMVALAFVLLSGPGAAPAGGPAAPPIGPPAGAPPYPAEIQGRLRAALIAKGSDYQPRTRHRRADGAPLYTNRLLLETSPYLLQHAHNPVDWYPWGDEAFDAARGARRAGAAQRRLLHLPLVPRDGGGVVRGRGDRRAT